MSYADDLRAAAEAERGANQHPALVAPTEGRYARIDLTTPDRLLPLLDRLEQLERVAEAATSHDLSLPAVIRLINGMSLPMEMGPSRDRWVRCLQKLSDLVDELDRS